MPVMNDYEATAAIRRLPGAWDKQTGNIERGFWYDRNEIYISEATAVCGCVGFYSRADRSASYPNCNGTYEEQLSRKERITYHYRSKPNPNQYEFFEAQAVKIYQDEKHFFALVGFRHIDDIMEKETTIQNQLKQALDEARLSNEIISTEYSMCDGSWHRMLFTVKKGMSLEM